MARAKEQYEHFNTPSPRPDHDPDLLQHVTYGGGCGLFPVLLFMVAIAVWVVKWAW